MQAFSSAAVRQQSSWWKIFRARENDEVFIINNTGTSIGVIVEPLVGCHRHVDDIDIQIGAQALGMGGTVGCAVHFSARAIARTALETLAANPTARAAYWLTSNSDGATVTVLGMALTGRPVFILRKNVKKGEGLIINTSA